MKASTVLVTLGVLGIGALAFTSLASAKSVPVLPPSKPGFAVVKGFTYRLQGQLTVPPESASEEQLASDLMSAGWAYIRGSFVHEGPGIETFDAVWTGPTGTASPQMSPRLKILNMALAPTPINVVPSANPTSLEHL
jgi:hypothetical protein